MPYFKNGADHHSLQIYRKVMKEGLEMGGALAPRQVQRLLCLWRKNKPMNPSLDGSLFTCLPQLVFPALFSLRHDWILSHSPMLTFCDLFPQCVFPPFVNIPINLNRAKMEGVCLMIPQFTQCSLSRQWCLQLTDKTQSINQATEILVQLAEVPTKN